MTVVGPEALSMLGKDSTTELALVALGMLSSHLDESHTGLELYV